MAPSGAPVPSVCPESDNRKTLTRSLGFGPGKAEDHSTAPRQSQGPPALTAPPQVEQMFALTPMDLAGNIDYKSLCYIITHGDEKEE